MASGSEGSQQSSRVDFNQILLESVNETIAAASGPPTGQELSHHLLAYTRLSMDEMASRVDLLFSSIRGSFGMQGDDVIKMIVRKMYEKAGVPFYEIGGQPMIQYVEELKARLAK